MTEDYDFDVRVEPVKDREYYSRKLKQKAKDASFTVATKITKQFLRLGKTGMKVYKRAKEELKKEERY